MIQSIYTSVSNGNRVECGKRLPKYKSTPIPLMKSNYLGEFRTALEKAKARKNLGIGDEYNLAWGNITGHIEDNADLVRFIEDQWRYSYVSPYIQQEINTVKEALDYALYYVSTYEANDQAVQNLSQQFDILTQRVNTVEQDLQHDIDENSHSIEEIENAIDQINGAIHQLNIDLEEINVDKKIENWVTNNLSRSKTVHIDIFEEEQEEGNPVTFKIIEVKVSQEVDNAIQVKEDGLYVQDKSAEISNINLTLDDVQRVQDETTQAIVDLKYNTNLPDSTTSPVHEGVTVEDLKNKTLSQILDTVLFPASTRDLIRPTLQYSEISTLVEINSPVQVPQVFYQQGDAGETIQTSHSLTFGGTEYTLDYYGQAGTYTFTDVVQFADGEYLLNNRGETTDVRVDAGQVTVSEQVKVTYPWYAGSVEQGVTKQILIPINEQSGVIDFSLGQHAIVKIPGNNSTIQSFRLDSGLGYLDVDMDGWTYSNETINGIVYKVWTKNDSYSAILPHRINFRIII